MSSEICWFAMALFCLVQAKLDADPCAFARTLLDVPTFLDDHFLMKQSHLQQADVTACEGARAMRSQVSPSPVVQFS